MRAKLLTLLYAFTALTSFLFVACDKKDKNEPSDEKTIVGTWRHDFSVGYQIGVFKDDGTGTMWEYDAEYGGIQWSKTFTYYYVKSSDQYKIVEKGDYNTHVSVATILSKDEMIIINPDEEEEKWYRED